MHTGTSSGELSIWTPLSYEGGVFLRGGYASAISGGATCVISQCSSPEKRSFRSPKLVAVFETDVLMTLSIQSRAPPGIVM